MIVPFRWLRNLITKVTNGRISFWEQEDFDRGKEETDRWLSLFEEGTAEDLRNRIVREEQRDDDDK